MNVYCQHVTRESGILWAINAFQDDYPDENKV